jgi:hypothetical protein
MHLKDQTCMALVGQTHRWTYFTSSEAGRMVGLHSTDLK